MTKSRVAFIQVSPLLARAIRRSAAPPSENPRTLGLDEDENPQELSYRPQQRQHAARNVIPSLRKLDLARATALGEDLVVMCARARALSEGFRRGKQRHGMNGT